MQCLPCFAHRLYHSCTFFRCRVSQDVAPLEAPFAAIGGGFPPCFFGRRIGIPCEVAHGGADILPARFARADHLADFLPYYFWPFARGKLGIFGVGTQFGHAADNSGAASRGRRRGGRRDCLGLGNHLNLGIEHRRWCFNDFRFDQRFADTWDIDRIAEDASGCSGYRCERK